ncbi:MAG TPA: EAL domain-containing protein, partial [Micromonospora sp.]
MPRRRLLLTLAVLAASVAAAVVGLAVPLDAPPDPSLPPVVRFGVAAGLMALAQLARLRFRVAAGVVSVAWGEAALIVGMYVAPADWLPAAAFVGAGTAWALLSIFGEGRSVLDVVHVAASLTAGVALAVTVTTALVDPHGATPTPGLAAALVLGSSIYLLTTVGLAALTLSLRHRMPVGPLLLRMLRGKLLMFVGNVLVGLVVVVMISHNPQWLLLLPPALWLLQQTYSHRLRADDERRTWREFAQATSALNQLDERGVATAGVVGALRLFGAELVDVEVLRRDGQWRRYRGDADGLVTARDLPSRPRGAANGAGRPGPTRSDDPLARSRTDPELTRSLVVGAVHVGELRIRLPRSVLPGHRDQAALSAFGDALGAALHDAATHRELRAVTARSSYEAVHDPLTGLVNRAAMLHRGDLALHQLGHEHSVALLLLDINHFKEVNDTLGHAAGDELLQVAAARLGTLVRPRELLGRLGGDEFALLVPTLLTVPEDEPVTLCTRQSASMPYALGRAREIVKALAVPTEVAGVRMSVEASVGVVVAGAGTVDMTELLRRADIAMYQAKEGGSSIACYDSSRDAASTDKLALLAELREALETDDQLVLALQPAVDLDSGAPVGVEALIRWNHPRRGWLNPGDFVRTVEGSELLGAFTRYVIDRALTVASDWARHGVDVPISINLSARSLLDPRLPAQVAESLRRHQVPPHRLELEITETVVMSELEVIDEVLAELRLMGVQIAVDDFGTGFSSLTFLTRVP